MSTKSIFPIAITDATAGRSLWISGQVTRRLRRYHVAVPTYGTATPSPKNRQTCISTLPFRFETGYAIQAKRPSRPFPPPFLSPPSSSFSDPLTTHFLSQDRRPSVKGEPIRGLTNGDDAILASEDFIGVNDGVGEWATRPQGHPA
jgi:protein phosphatase PTC7